MSRRNGNRSRFDRQRKSKMHNRTRIRAMRQALQTDGGSTKAETKPSK